jgi:hypothetical protein
MDYTRLIEAAEEITRHPGLGKEQLITMTVETIGDYQLELALDAKEHQWQVYKALDEDRSDWEPEPPEPEKQEVDPTSPAFVKQLIEAAEEITTEDLGFATGIIRTLGTFHAKGKVYDYQIQFMACERKK